MDPILQSENGEKMPVVGSPCENQPGEPQGLQAMTLRDFVAWREKLGFMMVGYVTGFSSNIKSCYNKSAVTRLAYNGLLALDGDAFNETGYTSIIPDFLRQPPDRNKPPRKVIVFLLAGQVEARASWERIEADFPGRLFLCVVDLDTDVEASVHQELGHLKGLCKASQDAYLLSRMVIKVTKAKRVLALGGDSVVAHVAEATVTEDNPKYLQVKWVVFALGRGRKERSISVVNWASETKSPLMDCFKRGLDKEEALAFADPETLGEEEDGELGTELPSPKADPPAELSLDLDVPANTARPAKVVGQLEETQVVPPLESAGAGIVASAAKTDPLAQFPVEIHVPDNLVRPAEAAGRLEETQVVPPPESASARIIATAERAAVAEPLMMVPPAAASVPVFTAPAVYAAPPPVYASPPPAPTAASAQPDGFEMVQQIPSRPSTTAAEAGRSDGPALSQTSLQRCCLADPLLFLRASRRGSSDGKLAPPFLAWWAGA